MTPPPPSPSPSPSQPPPRAASADVALHEINIQFVKGVGPKRALLLEKLGIRTVEDALWYLPWRYEDRTRIVSIADATPGEKVTIAGVIHRPHLRRARRRHMTVLTMTVCDDGGTADVVFFNQAYLEHVLKDGVRVALSGTMTAAPRGRRQLNNPHHEIVDADDDLDSRADCLAPVYHETRGLSSRQLHRIIRGLLDTYAAGLPDPLPQDILRRHNWPSPGAALTMLHCPVADATADATVTVTAETTDAAATAVTAPATVTDATTDAVTDADDVTAVTVQSLNEWRTPAHRRLAFEECFLLQVALALRQRMNRDAAPGIAFRCASTFTEPFHRRLPFTLTAAQRRVMAEIEADMRAAHPMNRLLQGDVGSGKTLVALHAMLAACGDGHQAALMAPTEILAEQHALTIQPYLEALGLSAALLTGGMSSKTRGDLLARIARGDVPLVVGTHALLEQDVRFASLGLVVVDEQHKFGVLQRGLLRNKGLHPDVLVMTATPIPRTLAMTAYGDLDVSVIDELPAGRQPVHTRIFRHGTRRRAYELVRKAVREGQQAYIVYPLVEESDKLDLEAVLQAADRLRAEEFPDMTLACLHGRMTSAEKAGVMRAFKAGDIQILAATQVIEVGVDVPNATVMVVEHADWFGLAQLHQLRGRVGRGTQRSFCFLISSAGRRSTRNDLHESPAADVTVSAAHAPSPSRAPVSSPTTAAPSSDTGRAAWLFPAAAPLTAPTKPTRAAEHRLRAMVRHADGFAIAEQDLTIRGPGDVLGTRQWGLPELRVADVVRDAPLMEQARTAAFALVARDPLLEHPAHQQLKGATLQKWQAKLDLGSIG